MSSSRHPKRSGLIFLCLAPVLGLLVAVGCAAQTSAPLPPQHQRVALQSNSNSSFSLLYRFKGRRDGAFPQGLIVANGALYGTTSVGGGGVCDRRCGTIFKWLSGSERVVHRFRGAPNDGAYPTAELILFGGKFYGTTAAGGQDTPECNLLPKTPGCGTVFSISPTGLERVVYRFEGGPDGELPYAGLGVLNGELFGVASSGGGTHFNPAGAGLVFAVGPSGKERVVYRFGSDASDGAFPDGTLVALNNKLYGTTNEGGTGYRCRYGCGTVFAVTPNGQERVLHSFANGNDGAGPWAGLTPWHGVLYGTTVIGGPNNKGTVFVITTAGKERVLYAFKGGSDGSGPYGGVLVAGGNLYGTTQFGGTFNSGIIFELTPSGRETVLYNFTGERGGAYPGSNLTAAGGHLYGSTVFGGYYLHVCAHANGCGTIFDFKL